jgi:hypothetical protein
MDAPGGAVEEPHAQLAFEPADLLAHRRLDDADPLGGDAESALLGDGHEVLQLAQFHPAPRFISIRDDPGSKAPVVRGLFPGSNGARTKTRYSTGA